MGKSERGAGRDFRFGRNTLGVITAGEVVAAVVEAVNHNIPNAVCWATGALLTAGAAVIGEMKRRNATNQSRRR